MQFAFTLVVLSTNLVNNQVVWSQFSLRFGDSIIKILVFFIKDFRHQILVHMVYDPSGLVWNFQSMPTISIPPTLADLTEAATFDEYPFSSPTSPSTHAFNEILCSLQSLQLRSRMADLQRASSSRATPCSSSRLLFDIAIIVASWALVVRTSRGAFLSLIWKRSL